MNNVREIQRINDRELDLALSGASWHNDYKDSAYIFVGGLNTELTEGDVVTIFSQYGEVMDVNMPRDKDTGKPKGFAFMMYEDQRSTVLAVDNLNGAKVLERTLRVDHVKNYKQKGTKGEDGEWIDAEEQSMNVKPEMIVDDDGADSASDVSSGPEIDPEDPMYEYLVNKRKEEKALKKAKKAKSKSKHVGETPEERRARKEKKKAKKEKKRGTTASGSGAGSKRAGDEQKSIEELLRELEGDSGPSRPHERSRTRTPPRYRSRSRTPPRRADAGQRRSRSRSPRRQASHTSGRDHSRRSQDDYDRPSRR